MCHGEEGNREETHCNGDRGERRTREMLSWRERSIREIPERERERGVQYCTDGT